MTNYDFIDEYVTTLNHGTKAVHGHMFYVNNTLTLYSTDICTYSNGIAHVNMSKISATTSKIQTYVIGALNRHGIPYVEEYNGINGYYWNYGYMGAPVWSKRELKERGIF